MESNLTGYVPSVSGAFSKTSVMTCVFAPLPAFLLEPFASAQTTTLLPVFRVGSPE